MNRFKINFEFPVHLGVQYFESISHRILSYLRFFEPSRSLDTWSIFRSEIEEKLDGSNFELSQSQMHTPSCDTHLLPRPIPVCVPG